MSLESQLSVRYTPTTLVLLHSLYKRKVKDSLKHLDKPQLLGFCMCHVSLQNSVVGLYLTFLSQILLKHLIFSLQLYTTETKSLLFMKCNEITEHSYKELGKNAV